MFPIREEDGYYGRFSRGFFYLRRAMALQNEEAIKDARDADTGSVSRRTLILDIEEARMHLKRRSYDEAARIAVQSLDTARSINSKLNIVRIGSFFAPDGRINIYKHRRRLLMRRSVTVI